MNETNADSTTQSCTDTRTVKPNVKNPPKIRLKKFVKLTIHTCACNSLTNFELKTYPLDTEKYVNLLKFDWKNSWNQIKWTYFVVGFSYLELLWLALSTHDSQYKNITKWKKCLFWTLIHQAEDMYDIVLFMITHASKK